MRKWLNSDFINSAFNEQQRKKIQTTYLTTPQVYCPVTKEYASGGRDTTDKVFLLSVDEVKKYFKVTSVLFNNDYYFGGLCIGGATFLRSPGGFGNRSVSYISYAGKKAIINGNFEFGDAVDGLDTISPAIWVSIY